MKHSNSSNRSRHKAIYGRLSELDHRLSRRGLSVESRRALWAQLDEHPMLSGILSDPKSPAMFRDAVARDIDECRRVRERAWKEDRDWVADSIYELLLAFMWLCPDGDDFVFRGHLDADWPLVPSFFRMKPRLDMQLHARMVFGAYRWAEKSVGQRLKLTPFGAEAAAQHYGAGTTLLDVTESIRVAAYFATTHLRAVASQSMTGCIYVLSTNDLREMGRGILRGRDLPEALQRIHRTKGAFLSALKYSDSTNAKFVQQASDIVEWMNAELTISLLDEAGIGVFADFLASPREESTMLRFRQGEPFSDEMWGVSRRQFGY